MLQIDFLFYSTYIHFTMKYDTQNWLFCRQKSCIIIDWRLKLINHLTLKISRRSRKYWVIQKLRCIIHLDGIKSKKDQFLIFLFWFQAVFQTVIKKTKDWALVQTAALVINQGFKVRLGRLGWPNLF